MPAYTKRKSKRYIKPTNSDQATAHGGQVLVDALSALRISDFRFNGKLAGITTMQSPNRKSFLRPSALAAAAKY